MAAFAGMEKVSFRQHRRTPMSMHWNSDKDLQLMKLLFERQNARRSDDTLTNLHGELRLVPHPYREHLSELTVNLKLGHKIEIDLYEEILSSNAAIDEIETALEALRDGIEDIESASDLLVADVIEFRAHLRKRLQAERRKGASIKASIGIGRVRVDYAREIGPVLTLDYVREDLRIHRTEFNVDTTAQIDEAFDDFRDELLRDSKRLNELESIGAVGQVHPLFVHALRQRNLPVEQTLRSIHGDLDMVQSIRMENDEDHIIAYWKQGVLTGTFRIDTNIGFQERRIRLDAGQKEVPVAARGREASDVLAIEPALPKGVVIEAVRKKDEYGQELMVEPCPMPFDVEGNLIQ
ncbi:hypothetical protein [Qipengyuania flava]|uniref:hypothetical protein n=1 Tax=Qipengyuania flava TaxID=192812 RepID=UPI001CD7DFA9|nr:hypothetical protein [Qipengyuania flava]MCA0891268.1 hypothetical protein [Qipengyuania flava]